MQLKRILFFVLFLPSLSHAGSLVTLCTSGCTYSSLATALTDAYVANDGRVIQIPEGQTLSGGHIIPFRATTSTDTIITVRSSGMGAIAPDIRISSANTHVAILDGGVDFSTGVHHVRFEGLKFTMSTYKDSTIFMDQLGPYCGCVSTREPATQPHHIWFDRIVISMPATVFSKNSIDINGTNIYLSNSYIAGAHSGFGESHALAGANGSGPFYWKNNYIEAESIGILMGGVGPNMRGAKQKDLFVSQNLFMKPWKIRTRTKLVDPTNPCFYDSDGFGEWWYNSSSQAAFQCNSGSWASISSATWHVQAELPYGYNKNIFEYKNVDRSIVEGNTMTQDWFDPNAGQQQGSCVLLNQVDGGYDEGTGQTDEKRTTLRHIVFQNNRLDNCGTAIVNGIILDPGIRDYFYRISDIMWSNNIWQNIAHPDLAGPTGSEGRGFGVTKMGDIGKPITINHTTFLAYAGSTKGAINFQAPLEAAVRNFRVLNNIIDVQARAFVDSWSGGGSLWNAWGLNAKAIDGREFAKNVLPQRNDVTGDYGNTMIGNNIFANFGGGDTPIEGYAAGLANFHPDYHSTTVWYDTSAVQFANYSTNNYRLNSGSPFKNWGLNGEDPGADQNVIDWATITSTTGVHSPYDYFTVRAVVPTTGSTTLNYSAPSLNACTINYSPSAGYTTYSSTTTDSGGAVDRSTTTAISAGRYWGKVTCDSMYRKFGPVVVL